MDGTRFDGITRTLATGATRRRTLLGIAGSVVAGLLGQVGVEEAAAACVTPGKNGCQGPRNKKCCTGATCQGGTKDKVGKCVCKRSLKQCGKECVDTKTDKTNCGSCNKRCAAGHTCDQGRCVAVLGCRAGQHYCSSSKTVFCPGSTNLNCACATDVEGNPWCADLSATFCQACTSNADCGPGRVCFDASGANCQCAGNACAATCLDSCQAGQQSCGGKCVDTKTDPQHCGGCNRPCRGQQTCDQGTCVGPLGCRAGQQYCGSNPVRCPGSTNPNCYCATDVHGFLHCVDPINSTCSTCTNNAACGSGQVCIPANNAGPCDCPANGCATKCVN